MSLPDSITQVFANEMLLERILDLIIHDSIETLQAVRLVDKAWSHSAALLFRKTHKPMFHLNERTVDQYHRSSSGVITFNLKLHRLFFVEKNYSTFLRCLSTCGAGLLELNIDLPRSMGSFPCIFPALELPALKTLIITFDIFPNEYETIFLNALLNASWNLRTLRMGSLLAPTPAPAQVQYLTLPSTLCTVELACGLCNNGLSILTRNEIPTLTKLTINLDLEPLTKGILHHILIQYSNSLKKLKLLRNPSRVRQVEYFVLPVLNALTHLTMSHTNLELDTQLGNLERKLPQLKSIHIYWQSTLMLEKWINNSKFVCVDTFGISIQNGEFTREQMEAICTTFPNIRHLYLIFTHVAEFVTLEYIFSNMTNLNGLHIAIDGNALDCNPLCWDTILTGTTNDFVQGLRASQAFWQNITLSEGRYPSIRKLTDLQDFSLHTRNSHSLNQTPLISDVTFHFALLQMPNLKWLVLKGRFQASDEMVRRWEHDGRNISQ